MHSARTLVMAVCLLAAPASAGAVGATDIRGVQVELGTPARRVVSLAPHITELLFAIGAGEHVVATVEYSDYPEAARSLPRVGDAFSIDREALLALAPELVVVWQSGNPKPVTPWLEGHGLDVYVTDARTFADVPRALRDLGRLTGNTRQAERVARAAEDRRDQLAERYADRTPVRVFYQISPRPLYTIGGEHLLTEMLRLCGGVNVFADLTALAPAVSTEAVIQRDPDAIVAGSWPAPESPLAIWEGLAVMRAVRDGNLYTVDANLLHRATPRLLDGVEQLCGVLERARRP